MSATTRYCVVAGGIALASASWEIRGTGPDGDPVKVRGASADLLRRHGDGRWLLVGTTRSAAPDYPPRSSAMISSQRSRHASQIEVGPLATRRPSPGVHLPQKEHVRPG
jgi:hypothetical protein